MLVLPKGNGGSNRERWPKATQQDYGTPGPEPRLPAPHLSATAVPVTSSLGSHSSWEILPPTFSRHSCLRTSLAGRSGRV